MIATFECTFPGTWALAAQVQAPSGGLTPILTLVLPMVIMFYLLIWMPNQRRQKKVNEMLRNLKSGDKIITNSGIYGTIVGLENDAVQLRIADQVKIKLSRSAIAGLQSEPPKES